jgi:hypothetical protein
MAYVEKAVKFGLMLDTGTLSILQDDPRHPELRVIALWNAAPAYPA